MTLTIILLSATLIALVAGVLCFRMLRKLTNPQVTSRDLDSWIDINFASNRPMERLLDPTEFEFLRKRGLNKERIEQLRAQRRQLFRMYLRRLTMDFNTVCSTLSEMLVNSAVDRPDLARTIGEQRMLFYRKLVEVEVRLRLSALGFDMAPTLDLIRPLQMLHEECSRLIPAALPAGAGA
jgi:hypothetical protein